ncbi:hypothetical protein HDU76_006398 [Blyttiomyces sp. JEL0837]|nr:hypothetical protein HDU76_006398 [Blyttiomyces sp. JEL0837]
MDSAFMVEYLNRLAIQSVLKNPINALNVRSTCTEYQFDINTDRGHHEAVECEILRLMGALKPKENLTLIQSNEVDVYIDSLLGLSNFVNLRELEIEDSATLDINANTHYIELPNLLGDSIDLSAFLTVITKCRSLEHYEDLFIDDAADFCLECVNAAQSGGISVGFPRLKSLNIQLAPEKINDFMLFAERLNLAFPNLKGLSMRLHIWNGVKFSPSDFMRVFTVLEQRSEHLVKVALNWFIMDPTIYRDFDSRYAVPVKEFFHGRRMKVEIIY